jgi:membrane-associated protein
VGQALQAIQDIDAAMGSFIRTHGAWVYPMLFLVALTQTGFLLGPVLPGSTIVFICGVFSRTEPQTVNVLLVLATGVAGGWLGCHAHYFIGQWAGTRAFNREKGILSKETLAKTEAFFEKHGTKTMFLAPSLPFMRTFSSVVAGAAGMPLPQFSFSAACGVTFWVGSMTAAGYLAGLIPGAKTGVLGLVALISIVLIARLAWQAKRGNPHPQKYEEA